MNKKETLQILTLIKVAFPNAYSKFTDEELNQTAMLWEAQFKDYEFEVVAIATNTFIAKDLSGFAPTIAQIKNIIADLMNPNKRTDDEIWLPVHEAICNGYYNTQEVYEALPDDIKECVTPTQIRDWSTRDSDEMPFIRKEVIGEYRQKEARKREYELLPSKAKQLLIGAKNEDV